MRGMGDRSIGHALVLMHVRFSGAWSLALLAKATQSFLRNTTGLPPYDFLLIHADSAESR